MPGRRDDVREWRLDWAGRMGKKGLRHGRRFSVRRDAQAGSPGVDAYGDWPEGKEATGGRALSVETPACRPARSARLVEVVLRFGLPLAEPPRRIVDGLKLSLRPGSITLVKGPSGAGKTLLLEALARRFAGARLVQACPFPVDVPIIDAVAAYARHR